MNCNCSPKKHDSVLLQSEDGFVLLVTMMVMVALTLLGLAATTTTVFEIQIAGNEKFSQEQFFQADSSVNQFLITGTEPNILQAQGAGFACQDDLIGANSLTSYNPGGIPGSNVWVFFARRIPDIPAIDEFRICAVRGNGRTIASLTVGINFDASAAGLPGSGGLEY